MALRIVPVMLGLLQIAVTLPATMLQDLEVADDTMSVGSYVREVRAAPVSMLQNKIYQESTKKLIT